MLAVVKNKSAKGAFVRGEIVGARCLKGEASGFGSSGAGCLGRGPGQVVLTETKANLAHRRISSSEQAF